MTRLIFMGTPDFAVPTLEKLAQAEYELVGVYTQPDKPAGRGRKLESSPVKDWAAAHQLPIFQPRTLRAPEPQAELAALYPDVIVVAAYGLILPRAVLDLPPHGCINVHASLLPCYRGAAPIAAAILNGETRTGITIMQMDEGVDTGPMLMQSVLEIAPTDTTATLSARLARLGADLLGQALPHWLAGQLAAQPQPETGASFAPRLSKAAGCIDWMLPAVVIEQRIRAFDPWPGAFTTWRGQRLKINRASVALVTPSVVDCRPGQVVEWAGNIGVMTGAGVLELYEVQLAGKRVMGIAEFLCGHAACVGAQLGD
jgi:methionyl-tRNA formyltransferase